MNKNIVVFGHLTCPGVGPLTGLLKQAQVPFDYIDIHRDPAGAAQVRAINHGNESVPTVLFPDGSTLTEPTVGALQAKLEALGYTVGLRAWLIGNAWRIFVGVAIILALLRFLGVF